jgi:hypothetical protein
MLDQLPNARRIVAESRRRRLWRLSKIAKDPVLLVRGWIVRGASAPLVLLYVLDQNLLYKI